MVRTKDAASKSRFFHATEPDSSIPSEQEEAHLPLPVERGADQPAITSFFKRTPAKDKGKAVLEQEQLVTPTAAADATDSCPAKDKAPLISRRFSTRKGAQAQTKEQTQEAPQPPMPSAMSKAKETAQPTTKGKVAPKLTLRKSTRMTKEKEPQLKEAATVEQPAVSKKAKSRQIPKPEVTPTPVDKGKRKLEDIQPSMTPTTEPARTKFKGIHISEPSSLQSQVEGIVAPAPQARKKQKVTKSEKLTKSKKPSPVTQSREKTVEAPTPVPIEKSKTRQEEKGNAIPESAAKASPPLRKKTLAHKSKTPKVLPSTSAHFPFISAEAKKIFETRFKSKSIIRERALLWNSPKAAPEVKDIIQHLHWEKLCAKPDEAMVALVKEFYANAQEEEDDKVFVRGIWVDVSSKAINKVLNTPDFEVDEYFEKSVKGIRIKELEKALCQSGTKTNWTQGKKGKRNFHTDALQPFCLPLFKLVCCRLLPTTHTSDVTMDRAILLYAMVKKLKIDVGSIIKTAMNKMGMPSKALWFPALVTQLCLNAGVKVAHDELKIKPGQPISATALEDKTLFGGHKATHTILTELAAIKKNQEQLLHYAKFQQDWNQSMMMMCTTSAAFPVFNKSFFSGKSTGGEGPSTTPAEMQREEPLESEEENDDEENQTDSEDESSSALS